MVFQMLSISWRSASDRAPLGLQRLSLVWFPSFLRRSKLCRDMPSSCTHTLYLVSELWASQMSSTALFDPGTRSAFLVFPPDRIGFFSEHQQAVASARAFSFLCNSGAQSLYLGQFLIWTLARSAWASLQTFLQLSRSSLIMPFDLRYSPVQLAHGRSCQNCMELRH